LAFRNFEVRNIGSPDDKEPRGLYIEKLGVAKPEKSLKWHFGISGIGVSACPLTRIQDTSIRNPEFAKREISVKACFNISVFWGLGIQDCGDKCFGIESFELLVPGSPK
jgi:hypothetical protein